ncbi:MAG: hypothetical protein HYZ42_17310 [Bacteroidetes bacterium]|nr:hypothetical protein [Bacteroidota bacterium]
MALYRFKVIFEDYDEVLRVIDIKSVQTFFDLHIAIQESIGFDKSQLSSFYLSDDLWKKGYEITLDNMHTDEDMSDENFIPTPIMKECRLCDFINDPHQKFVYVFDFLNMWTLYVELTDIILSENPKLNYPSCVKSVGVAPKQYVDKKFTLVDDDEFEEITENFLAGHEDGIDEEDEELFKNDEEDTEFGGTEKSILED